MARLTLLLIAVGTAFAGLARQQPAPADLVVLNARVLTVDDRFSIAEAVAVRAGRFTAVGSNDDIRRHIGSATTVIDAKGRTMLPGLIDTHVHALDVATAEATQPFRNLRSVADVQAWLRAEAPRRAKGSWIWTPRTFPTRLREQRFPTRAELDAAAPDHPVIVDSAYAFTLNTAALRAAGITRETPNPTGGSIVKDASGEPTGLLRNAGAMLAAFRSKGEAKPPLDTLEQVHRRYLAAGLTSIIERGATLDGYRIYDALRTAGRLHIRSTVTIRVPQASDAATVERFVRDLPVKFGEGTEWLKAGPLKLVADGGILIGTSFMRAPYGPGARQLYAIDDPGDRGFLTLTGAQLATALSIGHRLGWQMVVHVTGDAGVDTVLDGIERALKDHPSPDRRHTLIHAYFVTPETASRAARLGVLVDTQPAWQYKDGDALTRGLGAPRVEHFIGLRTWRNAGVTVAINTDHMFGLDANDAMNPFNPFMTMAAAITRRTDGGLVMNANEAVTREEALRMMTSAAARFTFDEKDRGSIAPGLFGDFVIVDRDFLTVPPDDLRATRVDLTAIGGKVVFQK